MKRPTGSKKPPQSRSSGRLTKSKLLPDTTPVGSVPKARGKHKRLGREVAPLAGREWIEAQYALEQVALAEVRKLPRALRRAQRKTSAPPAQSAIAATAAAKTNRPSVSKAVSGSSRLRPRFDVKILDKKGRPWVPGPRKKARVTPRIGRRSKAKIKRATWNPKLTPLSESVPDKFLSSGLSGGKWPAVRAARPLSGGLPGLGKKR